LFLTTFDPAYAAALGFSTAFWHYLLMAAVSLTTVVSFESVGAILVVAFLIGPAATAYLLTNNFKVMLVLSAVIGILTAISGYYLAVWVNGSIAGAMATMVGFWFLMAFLFSPLQGVLRFNKKLINLTDSY
ncbi:MAG: metal ABC transporter permease, partial [Chitinophagales bacterium]